MARGPDGEAAHQPRGMVSLLIKHRDLTWELAKRELSDRYVGQWLGMFWVVAHPLFMVSVYVFVFAVVLKIKLDVAPDLPGDYVVYLLAGLIPWLAFQDVMARSCGAVTGHAPLVKQVVFPVEVLPVKGLASSLVMQMLGMGVLVVYVLVRQRTLPATYALLPVLLALQVFAMVGVSYLLAAVSVYVRDLKDMVQVFGVIGVYLMPVVYLPDWTPSALRPILYLNPFSYMTWCYQDALFYGRIQRPWAWPAFLALSVTTFYVGSRVFRYLKTWFGSAL
jgi:homopolymeric O-antigen transport system permease protein